MNEELDGGVFLLSLLKVLNKNLGLFLLEWTILRKIIVIMLMIILTIIMATLTLKGCSQ